MNNNNKQKRSFCDLSLTSLCVVICPILLLLLLSSFSVILKTLDHNIAFAIPNEVLPNNTSGNASTMSSASFVQTDKKSYLPGENVNIVGKINQIVPGEKRVRIDIYDPKGGIAYSDLPASLDEKNTFTYTLYGNGIPNTKNIEPGKYKMVVTYNRETVAQTDLIIVPQGRLP